MATIYYDADANIELIQQKRIAVIGYGSQGHAHALNMQRLWLRCGGRTAQKQQEPRQSRG